MKSSNKKFYLYPGVFKTEGKTKSLFVNMANGDVYNIENSYLQNEKNKLEVFQALKDLELGIIEDNEDLSLEKQEKLIIPYESNLRALILNEIYNLKYVTIPIYKIDFFYTGKINKRAIIEEAESLGYVNPIDFYPFEEDNCPYNRERRTLIPYSYYRNIKYNPCWGNMFAIGKKGEVKPCLWSNIVVGIIHKDEFSKIIENIEYYWHFNKDKINDCQECEYRYICSDCRVEAMKDGGKIENKTKGCDIYP
jgi:radical SAM protein with 4Fe4S-binding SPASM domain